MSGSGKGKLPLGLTKQNLIFLGIGLAVLLIGGLYLLPSTSDDSKSESHKLAYGGGPVGGTFIYFATAMSTYLTNHYDDIEVFAEGSGGSTENLRRLDSGDVDFGIVYAVDAALGRRGLLPNDDKQYRNLRVVSFLYGSPAQLVTSAASGITSVAELEGKRVAVGNAGSGAAASAERFLRHVGLWDNISRQHLGYSRAAQSLSDGRLDAFWLLTAAPNAAVIEAASRQDITLLDVGIAAENSGFYQAYAYIPSNIPSGTYSGQSDPVSSFQDNTLWMANKDVSDEIVYRVLKAIYSGEGLAHMVQTRKSARSMTIPDGLKGASIPVHPGAIKFWTEQGIDIPAIH